MADAVIIDDNGGGRGGQGRSNPVGPTRIRRQEATEIRMDELIDPKNLKHRIFNKQIQDVTVTVGAVTVVQPTPATSVTVTISEDPQPPHNVTFTVANNGSDVLVTSSEDLVKPKKHEYTTNDKAIITMVVGNTFSKQISGNGAAVVTVTYA